MTNALTSFVFDDTDFPVVDYQGKPAFLVGAVCMILGIVDPRTAVQRLDDDQKGKATMHTLGGPQQVNVVTESGFYRLVLTSRKPTAQRFARWVTDEVLPSIRKTGQYGASDLIQRLEAENSHLRKELQERLTQAISAQRATERLLTDLEANKDLLKTQKRKHDAETLAIREAYQAMIANSDLPELRMAQGLHPFRPFRLLQGEIAVAEVELAVARSMLNSASPADFQRSEPEPQAISTAGTAQTRIEQKIDELSLDVKEIKETNVTLVGAIRDLTKAVTELASFM